MIDLKYREDLYAEKILELGFLTQYHLHELKILAKYFKSIGKKPKECKELIYQFCEKHIKNFNKVLYFRKINTALKYGQKKYNKLIIITEIPVYPSEFEYINNLEIDHIHKKVAFTLLVQNKINKMICICLYGKQSDYNFFGGKMQHYKETLLQSKIPSHINVNGVSTKIDIHKIINELSNQGIIKIGSRGRIDLSFVNDIATADSTVLFNIVTFDDIGYYYDFHNKVNGVIKCDSCGKLIKKTGKNQQMCRECSKEREKETKRNWWNKNK